MNFPFRKEKLKQAKSGDDKKFGSYTNLCLTKNIW